MCKTPGSTLYQKPKPNKRANSKAIVKGSCLGWKNWTNQVIVNNYSFFLGVGPKNTLNKSSIRFREQGWECWLVVSYSFWIDLFLCQERNANIVGMILPWHQAWLGGPPCSWLGECLHNIPLLWTGAEISAWIPWRNAPGDTPGCFMRSWASLHNKGPRWLL